MKKFKNSGFSRIVSGRMPGCGLFLLFISLLLTLPFTGQAQSKKELERKKDQLRKDIDYTNQLLNQTRKNKSHSMTRLVTLKKKINYRAELINTINGEITEVDGQLGSVACRIDSLNARLERLKAQYAVLLVKAYKQQGAFSRLSFILSAEDMQQAYKRLKYLQQLSAYRVHQRDLIRSTQDSLSGKKKELQDVKSEKTDLLLAKQDEKEKLDREKREQESMLKNLSSNEKKLRAELKKKQAQEQLLSLKIEQLIRKEIETARSSGRKRSESTATASINTKVTAKTERYASPSVLSNTPESLRLSNDFESNKGRLPWPVEQGIITGTFGQHPHPAWKDVMVNNNGINISSARGSKARAIFDGKVIMVFKVAEKFAVLVQHGEYFTVYSNLETVSVSNGDKVSAKQPLGSITDSDGRAEVHLEIWKGSVKMNPEPWLASR